jgi:YNFM family putative membrane transporter
MSLGDPLPPRPRPRKISRSDAAFWRITGPLAFGGFSTFALLYSVQPLMPVFAREFAVSPALASLSLSATTAVLAVAMIGAGAVSEVCGRKRLMVFSLAASSLATMLAALAADWPTLLGLRALAGLALSGLPAVAMAYLGDEMDAQAIGLAMGSTSPAARSAACRGGSSSPRSATIAAGGWRSRRRGRSGSSARR